MNAIDRGLDASAARAMARELCKTDKQAALVEIQRAASLAIKTGYCDRMKGLPMPSWFVGDDYLAEAWKYGVKMAEQTIMQLQCARCNAANRTGRACQVHQDSLVH